MTSRVMVMLAGTAMAMAIVVLGWRVWQLEWAVDSLTQQIQHPQRVLYAPASSAMESSPSVKRNVFRLLDSGKSDGAEARLYEQ